MTIPDPRALFAFVATAFLAACSEKDDLMPLAPGRSWTYVVRHGLERTVGKVVVTRPLPVGDHEGFELAGPLGVSHLAWGGGRLICDQSANARWTPPVALLPAGQRTEWRGWLDCLGKREAAKATTTKVETKLTIAGREVPVTRSTLSLRTPHRTMTLDTWFQSGVGIVLQEQRIDNHLDIQLQLLRE